MHTPYADIERLYAFFATWEFWTAEVLESHVSYPMLVYFRSQSAGQSWITALAVVLEAATLACAVVPGADRREPYFVYRRGRQALSAIAGRLRAPPGAPRKLDREEFASIYTCLREDQLQLVDLPSAWERFSELHASYASTLQGLLDYLLAPDGFWARSAELD